MSVAWDSWAGGGHPRATRGRGEPPFTGPPESSGSYRGSGRTLGLARGGCPGPGRMSGRAAGGCGCRARTALFDRGAGGFYARRRDPPRGLVLRPEAQRRDELFTSPLRRSCRPSFAVAFEYRLAHRAQGKACVSPQPVRMPFETRDRRQVHRGPRVPVQRRREARQPPRRPLRRLDRGISRRAMPAQGPAYGPGSPTRRWQP